jgi:hypothetical protein
LENNDAVQAAFTVQARDAPFERKKLARWASVAKHARHAVALSLQLTERLSQAAMLRQAIDSAGFVCVMVDNESKPIDCSSAGDALIACGGVLKVGVGGRLATVSEMGTKRLRQLITLASTGGGGGLIRVTNTADDSFCMIQVVPGGVSTVNPFDPRYAGCALVFVRQPSLSRAVDVEYVRLALDCTRAEAEVGAALASGHSPARISVDRGVAVIPSARGSGSTKNRDAREATTTPTVRLLLQECVRGKAPDDHVFTRSNGRPVRDFRRAWRTACVAAGVGRMMCKSCDKTVSGEKCETCGARGKALRYSGLNVYADSGF